MKRSRYKQGIYKCINPQKYQGNVDNIVYRSGLEYRYFNYLDLNKNILKWSSEEIVVPYIGLDGKYHRYFLDLYVKVQTKEGQVKEFICEIKPISQITKPKQQKRVTRQWKEKYKTFLTNKSKWDAAEKYAKKMGWQFQIFTEHDL